MPRVSRRALRVRVRDSRWVFSRRRLERLRANVRGSRGGRASRLRRLGASPAGGRVSGGRALRGPAPRVRLRLVAGDARRRQDGHHAAHQRRVPTPPARFANVVGASRLGNAPDASDPARSGRSAGPADGGARGGAGARVRKRRARRRRAAVRARAGARRLTRSRRWRRRWASRRRRRWSRRRRARVARTRAVSLDLLRQLLEGPGSKAWLVRLAPFLGKTATFGAGRRGGRGGRGRGFFRLKKRVTRLRARGGARRPGHRGDGAAGARGVHEPGAPRQARVQAGSRAALPAHGARAARGSAPIRRRGGGGCQGELAALRVIRALASDPQVLVDVFVNHDCDARGDNLYERTIGALASTMAPGGATSRGSGTAPCSACWRRCRACGRGTRRRAYASLAGGSESLGTRGSGGRPRAEREPGSIAKRPRRSRTAWRSRLEANAPRSRTRVRNRNVVTKKRKSSRSRRARRLRR